MKKVRRRWLWTCCLKRGKISGGNRLKLLGIWRGFWAKLSGLGRWKSLLRIKGLIGKRRRRVLNGAFSRKCLSRVFRGGSLIVSWDCLRLDRCIGSQMREFAIGVGNLWDVSCISSNTKMYWAVWDLVRNGRTMSFWYRIQVNWKCITGNRSQTFDYFKTTLKIKYMVIESITPPLKWVSWIILTLSVT